MAQYSTSRDQITLGGTAGTNDAQGSPGAGGFGPGDSFYPEGARPDAPGAGGPEPGGAREVSGGLLLRDPTGLRKRWEAIQVGFVDDPRGSVTEAEELVSAVIDELVKGFSRQRENLEEQWAGGGDGSTDQLRLAFQRYRDFFDRLLLV